MTPENLSKGIELNSEIKRFRRIINSVEQYGVNINVNNSDELTDLSKKSKSKIVSIIKDDYYEKLQSACAEFDNL